MRITMTNKRNNYKIKLGKKVIGFAKRINCDTKDLNWAVIGQFSPDRQFTYGLYKNKATGVERLRELYKTNPDYRHHRKTRIMVSTPSKPAQSENGLVTAIKAAKAEYMANLTSLIMEHIKEANL